MWQRIFQKDALALYTVYKDVGCTNILPTADISRNYHFSDWTVTFSNVINSRRIDTL